VLFNSHAFIFGFLPVTLLVFFLLGRRHRAWAGAWLTAASLFFYGWWNPVYVGLLLASILLNYSAGLAIVRASSAIRARRLLVAAVAANLLLLGYYKYAGFFISNAAVLFGTGWSFEALALPLGISFFTFTQIAFLVDAFKGKTREYNLVHYGLFVTYFPHLIAGPILHHGEMMPQFADRDVYRPQYDCLAAGLTLFTLGLAKKVLIADGVAPFVAPVFDAPAAGVTLTALEAWCGALAYTFQLYFDFSGYSDMAIGLSLMFGIRLPANFHSPYKAASIIDFWRRWHMTLSRFLRDYLYVPLGGNRKGAARRQLNLLVTMLLGGLWHGAGWTFVVWGGLHGFFLMVNHGWRLGWKRIGIPAVPAWLAHAAGVLLTFVAVVIGWVFFRASDLPSALAILKAMCGVNGVVLPDAWALRLGATADLLRAAGVGFGALPALPRTGVINWIWILLLVVWIAPNTHQIMITARPVIAGLPEQVRVRWRWRPGIGAALGTAAVLLAVIFNLGRHSEFLYFQF
jgi:alginate O-acetyltransferase complex protein AlgI